MHQFESGFFVRQPAWHGLGEVLPEPPNNASEALEQAGLNWRVDLCPMSTLSVTEERINTSYKAIVRSSDDRVLGIVKDRWESYQNADAFEWTVPLIESKHWTYEAAGSLRQGEQCWILLKQDEVEIVSNDLLRQYLMVVVAHDGKSANYVQPTSIRVVCQNTLNQALNEQGVARFAVRHSQFVKMNMEQIKNLLNITTAAFEEQRAVFTKMAQKQIKKKKITEVLDTLFPIEGLEGRTQTTALKKRSVLEDAIEHGSGIQENGLAGTNYGVYVGISEALEHFLGGERIKDRGENILFFNGRKVLDKAFDLLAV